MDVISLKYGIGPVDGSFNHPTDTSLGIDKNRIGKSFDPVIVRDGSEWIFQDPVRHMTLTEKGPEIAVSREAFRDPQHGEFTGQVL